MSVLSEKDVGDIIYQVIDAYPTHLAPTGSIAIFNGVTFLNVGSASWTTLYKPVFGEIYYTGNVTATNPAQNSWVNDNTSSWVAGSMLGLTLSSGTLTASNTSISGLFVTRIDATITSATSRIYVVEIGPSLSNFIPNVNNNSTSVAASATDRECLSAIRIDEIDGNYFIVGKRWTVIGGSGGQSGFIIVNNKLSTSKIANIFTNIIFTDGFESGTFTNWTVVNGAQVNKWIVSTNSPSSGTYSAHISNGTSLSYTNTSASVSHIYTDIIFTGSSKFTLTFNWKCTGESNFDYGNVYLAPTSVVPVAGTSLATTYQVGLAQYNLQSTYQSATIALDSTYSNQTWRLIFSWRNDASLGTDPPFQIDNISLKETIYN